MNKKLHSNYFVEYYIDWTVNGTVYGKDNKIHHRSLNCEHN